LNALVCAMLAIAVTALPAHQLPAAERHIPDFEARYNIKKAGLNVISTTFTLTRGRGGIEYRSEAEPIGLASWFFGDHRIYEQSVLKQVDGQVIPLEYRYIHRGSDKNRNEHYRYNWEHNTARVNYRGEQKILKIPEGTLDKFSLQLALMQDAAKGTKKVTYPVISRGELKTYTFTNLGQETIETPLGKFEAIKLERRKDDGENTTYTSWHALKLHYLPVKFENQENGDVVLSFALEEVEWR
jgi:hypothetical protein